LKVGRRFLTGAYLRLHGFYDHAGDQHELLAFLSDYRVRIRVFSVDEVVYKGLEVHVGAVVSHQISIAKEVT
jgi:hypothetical protein